jgi:hypothetical protein
LPFYGNIDILECLDELMKIIDLKSKKKKKKKEVQKTAFELKN